MEPARFITLLDAHAPDLPLSLCPPLHAWQASEEVPLWQALEAETGTTVPPPMYALCWPGAQLLAMAMLTGTLPVEGRTVLDVGCGSGVAAVAAALKGARAIAADIDPYAVLAAEELARRHGVAVEARVSNPLEDHALTDRCDVILGGDLFYSREGAAAGGRAVGRWLSEGRTVALADAGRPFFNACGLPLVLEAEVAVPRSVEGVSTRVCRLYLGGGR